jgi:serine/threonine-protein kinase HipA
MLIETPSLRIGLKYPVNFGLYQEKRWFAFLLDILPSGAGRRVWAKRLGITQDYSSDLHMLLNGAGNSPGNIRVLEAVLPPRGNHPGFTREDVVAKRADFIEYADAQGAVVAGATDVAGDAPKYLLSRAKNGFWHPDGSLCDEYIQDCWLVRFPRGKKEGDFTVLRNEAPYYEVARRFGIRTGRPLVFENDALFIPRFDRVIGEPFSRLGLESLASASGISAYGVRTYHEDLCTTISEFATDPRGEIREYLRREILNLSLRNTDNHSRNTAFIKYPHGNVELSPLYDFAPMFLDPEGIARASIWRPGIEPRKGRPDWIAVGECLGNLHNDEHDLLEFLYSFAEPVGKLPAVMNQVGVEKEVIAGVEMRCREIAADLRLVGGRL